MGFWWYFVFGDYFYIDLIYGNIVYFISHHIHIIIPWGHVLYLHSPSGRTSGMPVYCCQGTLRLKALTAVYTSCSNHLRLRKGHFVPLRNPHQKEYVRIYLAMGMDVPFIFFFCGISALRELSPRTRHAVLD